MKIQYQLVTSSNIRAVAHQDGMLHIEFHGGRRFSYGHVPKETFDAMMAAKSIGSFFAKSIKGKFPVAERSQRCDNSPCEADATLTGVVSTTRVHLCGECAKQARFAEVALATIERGAQ